MTISFTNPKKLPPIFFNRTFDKVRLKNLISWYLVTYGEYQTIYLLEELKVLGFHNATIAGISLSIDDLLIPETKKDLIRKAEFIIQNNKNKYKRGDLTAIEQFQHMIDIWHLTSEDLKTDVVQNFRKNHTLNPVYMMAFSGARGNLSQVRQLVGMRGLMSDPQGQIIDYPITSNFREGLTLTEYVISCYGARKGIVDTALRTANSGYLTRRLVDVAQHVMISSLDCQTEDGLTMLPMFEGTKLLLSLKDRILGRALASNIYDGNILIASRNEIINIQLANTLNELYLTSPDTFFVKVRSPLTCTARESICQLCYGWSLAHNQIVSLGEAVGVIAAQSIGEPGTQLTMRTFHTGGVFTGDTFKQIKSPIDGIISYLDHYEGELIRTNHGQIAFLTKNSAVCKITDLDNAQQVEIAIPAFSILFFQQNEVLKKNDLIAEYSQIVYESNQRIQSKESFLSPTQGQVFFEDVLLGFKDFKNKNTKLVKSARQFGSIWVLPGNIQDSTIEHSLFAKRGDLINPHVPILDYLLINNQNGELKTITHNNQTVFGIVNNINSLPIDNLRWKDGYYINDTDILSKNFNLPLIRDENSDKNRIKFSRGLNELQKTKAPFWIETASDIFKIEQLNSIISDLGFNGIYIQQLQTNTRFINFPQSFTTSYLNSKNKKVKIAIISSLEINRPNLIERKTLQGSLITPEYNFTGIVKSYTLAINDLTKNNLTLYSFSIDWPYESKLLKLNFNSDLRSYRAGTHLIDDIIFDFCQVKLTIDICSPQKNKFIKEHVHYYSQTTNVWETGNEIAKESLVFLIQPLTEISINQKIETLSNNYIKFNYSKSKIKNTRNFTQVYFGTHYQTLYSEEIVNPIAEQLVPINTEQLTLDPFLKDFLLNTQKIQYGLKFFPFKITIRPIFSTEILHQNKLKTVQHQNFQISIDGRNSLNLVGFYFFKNPTVIKQKNLIIENKSTHIGQVLFTTSLGNTLSKNQIIAKRQNLNTQYSEVIFSDNSKKSRILLLSKSDMIIYNTSKSDNKNPNNIGYTPENYIAKFIRQEERIFNSKAISNPGQLIGIRKINGKTQLLLRKGNPFLFSSRAVFHINHNDLVQKGSLLLTLFYRRLQTGDIVQGIPKIEELFEARSSKYGEPIPNSVPEKLLTFYDDFSLKIPHAKAVRKSVQMIQQYLVENVQRVYQSQGVTISEKHLEIIIRQMTSKIKIIDGGQTGFLPGELINLETIELINQGIEGPPAKYEPILLGITKASLETKSFISAASFQETTRILARAAVDRKTDFLKGLKENVILGHVIPAGTGFREFLTPIEKIDSYLN